MATTANEARGAALDTGHRRVILASSLGTVFEWYDFYLYGSLAALIGKHFFSGLNETSQFIFALLAFAAGFAVRPFGAIVFGRLGDLIGRKYTFLITIIIMGLSTFLVGVLPSYGQIGIVAPTLLIILRLLQGLALGGEYGGAATYVAEHAPDGKRGLYTSFIQITATFGLFLSLLVILGTRLGLGTETFEAWGWRVPFLISAVLVAVSVYIRMQLQESPVFQQMKAEGKHSKAPLTEAFGQWSNLKLVILALLGATAGQAVVWYTGQFYSLYFLTQSLKIDGTTANLLIAAALLIGTPFFVFFGWLSDRIGRKSIVLAGCLIAALTFFPIFKGLTHFGNPDIEAAAASSPVVVVADPGRCSFQFDPVGKAKFTSSCDVAKSALAKKGVPYRNEAAVGGALAQVKIGDKVIDSFEGGSLDSASFAAQSKDFGAKLGAAIKEAGYPEKADPAKANYPMLIVLLAILVIYVTMVYGPIAAWLVEMFPTRIRYTSMSLPYHIGNGWFGGFVPTIGFMLVAWKGDIYYGLWYPIIVAIVTFFIGLLFLKETKDVDIRK
ncbi:MULTISPECIES: MFS transporter [Dyella]|uniref:MFS transporter n=2 Tax=Dyella TaxID=231454 RepID=A0A4R0YRT6_9GAMM|nr:MULTISPECIES: MFS transporter [Dyella]TBR35859.1 MFS transporter [Dyella terrae]TCI08593.1 MFS transporter [Dyella soli]